MANRKQVDSCENCISKDVCIRHLGGKEPEECEYGYDKELLLDCYYITMANYMRKAEEQEEAN